MTTKSSTSSAQTKVKLEFLTEPTPINIDVKLDTHMPLEITTARVSPDAYTIDIAVVPEKLQGVSVGMNKGEVTIVPEGVPNPVTMTLPIGLFVREQSIDR